ncbi:hypothetical protein SCA6_003163 [Theobroma cacao]
MSSFYFILLGLSFCFRNPSSSVAIYHEIPHRNLADSFCPLSFRVLRKVFDSSKLAFLDVPTKCVTILQGIRLVRSNYLRITGNFFPHPNSSEDCWDGYQKLVDESIPGFNIRSTCGYNTGLISESCKNITTGYQFEGLISDSKLQEVRLLCNRSLDDDSSCIPCQASLSSIYQSYFHGTDIDNASDCSGYPFIYAGALANQYGPTASGTAKCLFSLDLTSSNATSRNQRTILCAVTVGAGFGLFMTAVVVWFIWRRRKKWKRRQNNVAPIETGSGFGIETISGDSTLVKFTFEEIKRATKNFSRENIVGKGGYGNVYKGILEDGSEVALKRFKNCSAAGDATFAHEVEVIASISHVNLVAFRGYCTATVPMEGHQRIIVCDLVHNGSLYDHLFGSGVKKLSWPIQEGRVFDVIDENMPELGPPEVMERYVLVAVLSSHSQLYARPTMDQIVRILESDFPLHSIPKLPFSLPTDTDDGEKSANFSQLDSMSSTSAEQPCDFKNDSSSRLPPVTNCQNGPLKLRLDKAELLKLLYLNNSCEKISNETLVKASCPLNFDILRNLVNEDPARTEFGSITTKCQNILGGIHLVQSKYLQTNGYFVPPPITSEACWESYQKLIGEFVNDFDIETSCGYHAEWISKTCMNVTSRAQFESLIPDTKLNKLRYYCTQSLDKSFACGMCTSKLFRLRKVYLDDIDDTAGNISACSWYPNMYTAAFVNQFGPTDRATAKCLFSMEFKPKKSSSRQHRSIIAGVTVGSLVGLLGTLAVILFLLMRRRKKNKKEKINPVMEKNDSVKDETSLVFGFGLYSKSTSLIKFKIDEIKNATTNFSRKNIIGMGGYGNVYKGILPDGSEVAIKRFKNCSVAGDANFVHEVEVIASVKHVNLVALRGFCTATVPLGGHQRLIVCDLMQNGSLHDHLFGSGKKKLSWPVHVIEQGMPEIKSPEAMEQYVFIAVIRCYMLGQQWIRL